MHLSAPRGGSRRSSWTRWRTPHQCVSAAAGGLDPISARRAPHAAPSPCSSSSSRACAAAGASSSGMSKSPSSASRSSSRAARPRRGSGTPPCLPPCVSRISLAEDRASALWVSSGAPAAQWSRYGAAARRASTVPRSHRRSATNATASQAPGRGKRRSSAPSAAPTTSRYRTCSRISRTSSPGSTARSTLSINSSLPGLTTACLIICINLSGVRSWLTR
mmetsp:Transcript_6020/g.16030  ORF Transcript_6020/g.16030 Transcript_6020/m.16030 type:complete len:220 (+) Transcript_6020:723-1382(+)